MVERSTLIEFAIRFVGAVLLAVFPALYWYWLRRSRRPAQRVLTTVTLRYPWTVLCSGLVYCALFLPFSIGIIWVAIERPLVAFLAVVPVVALVGSVYIVFDAILAEHQLSESGINYRTPFRRLALVRWSDLRSARWSERMKWFVLIDRYGNKLRFSPVLNGFESLAAEIERRCPHLEMSQATRDVLQESARGNLPSITF